MYLSYSMQAPRERPGGYSTTPPPEALRVARSFDFDGRGVGLELEALRELEVRWVVEFDRGVVPQRLIARR